MTERWSLRQRRTLEAMGLALWRAKPSVEWGCQAASTPELAAGCEKAANDASESVAVVASAERAAAMGFAANQAGWLLALDRDPGTLTPAARQLLDDIAMTLGGHLDDASVCDASAATLDLSGAGDRPSFGELVESAQARVALWRHLRERLPAGESHDGRTN